LIFKDTDEDDDAAAAAVTDSGALAMFLCCNRQVLFSRCSNATN